MNIIVTNIRNVVGFSTVGAAMTTPGPTTSSSSLPAARYRKRVTAAARPLRRYRSLPVHVVEDHNEALFSWCRAIGSRHLPTSGITVLHIDAHPDLQIPYMAACDASDGPKLRQAVSIGSFITPLVYGGFISRVVWVRPAFANQQVPDGRHVLRVGRDAVTGRLATDSTLPYHAHDLSVVPTERLCEPQTLIFDVVAAEKTETIKKGTRDSSDRNNKNKNKNSSSSSSSSMEGAEEAAAERRGTIVWPRDIPPIAGPFILDICLDYFSCANPFFTDLCEQDRSAIREFYGRALPSDIMHGAVRTDSSGVCSSNSSSRNSNSSSSSGSIAINGGALGGGFSTSIARLEKFHRSMITLLSAPHGHHAKKFIETAAQCLASAAVSSSTYGEEEQEEATFHKYLNLSQNLANAFTNLERSPLARDYLDSSGGEEEEVDVTERSKEDTPSTVATTATSVAALDTTTTTTTTTSATTTAATTATGATTATTTTISIDTAALLDKAPFLHVAGCSFNQPHYPCEWGEDIKLALEGVRALLDSPSIVSSHPVLVTIARSAEDGYTPIHAVHRLNQSVMVMLEGLYGNVQSREHNF